VDNEVSLKEVVIFVKMVETGSFVGAAKVLKMKRQFNGTSILVLNDDQNFKILVVFFIFDINF